MLVFTGAHKQHSAESPVWRRHCPRRSPDPGYSTVRCTHRTRPHCRRNISPRRLSDSEAAAFANSDFLLRSTKIKSRSFQIHLFYQYHDGLEWARKTTACTPFNGPLYKFKASKLHLCLCLHFLHAAVFTRIFRHCTVLPTKPDGNEPRHRFVQTATNQCLKTGY